MTDSRIQKALAYWKKNPLQAVYDLFDISLDDHQAAFISTVFGEDNVRVNMKSAHGVGKTMQISICGWLMLIFYIDSRVVATAPTFSQLHDILWPEYAKWHWKLPDGLRDQWDISGNHIRNKARPKTHFAVARTSSKPSNLQGFHGSHLMIQGDEASGISPGVFEVIEGALSEAGEGGKVAKLLLTGNPNFTAGEFYQSFHKQKELYERFTVTGDPDLLEALDLKSGGYHKEHGRVFFAKRVTEKYRETMASKYGKGSPVYDVRVRGVFPRLSDDSVIPLQWAEQAALVPLPHFDNIADPVYLVVDVARKAGETVVGTFRKGHCIDLIAKTFTGGPEVEDMVLEKKRMWEGSGLRVTHAVVDEPGMGGPIIDGLRRRGMTVIPYNGGQPMRPGIDPDEDCRMFINRRARDYWNVRRLMELGKISIPQDETLINQLASVNYRYGDNNQKITVESKDAMKDRLGKDASPDRADVIVMGAAPWYSTQSVNMLVTEEDIEEGSVRERLEDDL